ncbi:MAG: cupin domain-containing protein [Nocardioidaceae bacterium]
MDAAPPVDRSARPTPIALGGGVEALIHLTGATSGGQVTIVEHPMAPGALIEPHTHQCEDEYSWVLSGSIGMLLGQDEFEATQGTFIAKPRGVLHAAWNEGLEPASFLEVIAPSGFEHFFLEVAEMFDGPAEPPAEDLENLAGAYGLTFHMDMVDGLIERHGLSAAVRYD